MAVNADNIAKAEAALAKLQDNLVSRYDSVDFNEADPGILRSEANHDALKHQIDEYYRTAQQTNETGHLVADSPLPQGETSRVAGDPEGLGTGYHYEPQVESVKQRLISDPALKERLGLRTWTPEGLQEIDENSSAYRAVADDDWKQAAEAAQKDKKNLTRYSKVSLKEHPFEAISGGIQKHLPGILTGLDKTMTLGLGRSGMESNQKTGQDLMAEATQKYSVPRYGQEAVDANSASPEETPESQFAGYEERSPGGVLAGQIGGYLSPASIGNQLIQAPMKAMNYAGRTALGKVGVGAIGGALSAVGEGAGQDAVSEINKENQFENTPEGDSYLTGLVDRSKDRAIMGGALGAGGDILSQAAKGIHGAVRESPRFQDIHTLENAGGRTHPIKGVTAPDAIKENIQAAQVPGNIGRPADIAAEKVAPQISKSVEDQARNLYKGTSENLEAYHNSPEGMETKRVTKPVSLIVDMLKKGLNKGDLGTIGDDVPEISNKLRQRLLNETERTLVSPDKLEGLRARYGDDLIVLDPKEAKAVLGKPTNGQRFPGIKPTVEGFEGNKVGNEPAEAYARTEPAPKGESVIDLAEGDIQSIPDSIGPKESLPGLNAELAKATRVPGPIDPSLDRPRFDSGRPDMDPKEVQKFVDDKFEPGSIDRYKDDQRALKLMDEFSDYTALNRPAEEAGSGASLRQQKNAHAIAETVKRAGKDLSNSEIAQSLGQKEIPQRTLDNLVDDGVLTVSNGRYSPAGGGTEPIKLDVNKVKAIIAKTDEVASKLSPEEVDAIHSYTSRHGDKVGTEAWKSAYDKLQIDNPTDAGPLYHGTRMTEQQLNRVLEKGSLDIKNPTSLSYNKDLSDAFSEGRTNRGDKVIFQVNKLSSGASFNSNKLGIGKSGLEREINVTDKSLKVIGTGEQDGVKIVYLEDAGVPRQVTPSGASAKGRKVVLIPRARNSRQIENIQQAIAEDLKGIAKNSDWLKSIDKAFRETRDKFKPNKFTPAGEEVLDNGEKVTGLSALQRKNHLALTAIEDIEKNTGANSKQGIRNKLVNFGVGGAGHMTADKELLGEAEKLGLQGKLRDVAGTNVFPQLRSRAYGGAGQGVINAVTDAALFRADPILGAIGNVPRNPFIQNPSTPAGRIQQYLFENSAKNFLNTQGGNAGRFGNEVADRQNQERNNETR